jgi:hypothetical protein
MGRWYDVVLMISRRGVRNLWTNRKLAKRIREKAMDFSKPEIELRPTFG